MTVQVVAAESDSDSLRQDREDTKLWFVRSIPVGKDFVLPVSPVTLFLGFLSICWLVFAWTTNQSYADASHILIKNPSKENEEKMKQWVSIIGSDAEIFGEYAKQYSECPSGKAQNGRLGKFRKGDMVPKFDWTVFDINTPEKTTIGPIRTNFGLHLIYIHGRQWAYDKKNSTLSSNNKSSSKKDK